MDREDSLTAHNNYRAKHGVAALKLNAELNALAQVLLTSLLVSPYHSDHVFVKLNQNYYKYGNALADVFFHFHYIQVGPG